MGRPRKDKQDRRSRRSIRFSEREWERITEAAERAGLLVSEFVRKAALREAGKK